MGEPVEHLLHHFARMRGDLSDVRMLAEPLAEPLGDVDQRQHPRDDLGQR
jgi:hypothetical protein